MCAIKIPTLFKLKSFQNDFTPFVWKMEIKYPQTIEKYRNLRLDIDVLSPYRIHEPRPRTTSIARISMTCVTAFSS